MKNLKLTILLLLTTRYLIAQETKDDKFTFGLNVYPNLSVGIITNNGSVPSSVENAYKGYETWKPSISSNIFVEYKIGEKSKLCFGLGYQNTGEKTHLLDLTFAQPEPDLPTQARFIYNYHNLELPLYYKRNFAKRLYLVAGTSLIFNLVNTTTSEIYYGDGSKKRNSSVDESTSFRQINLTANLGFGMNYFSNEKITLYLHPFFQTAFLGVSKSAPLNRTSLSLGLSTGIILN